MAYQEREDFDHVYKRRLVINKVVMFLFATFKFGWNFFERVVCRLNCLQ